jgi:hypothetical protein
MAIAATVIIVFIPHNDGFHGVPIATFWDVLKGPRISLFSHETTISSTPQINNNCSYYKILFPRREDKPESPLDAEFALNI